MIPVIVGKDPRNDRLYAYVTFCPDAGAGAVYGYDGYQCCCTGETLGVVSKSDVEEEMVRFPWRIERYEFMTDAHGVGKWRSAPHSLGGNKRGSDCGCPLALVTVVYQGRADRWGGDRFNKATFSAETKNRNQAAAHDAQCETGDILMTGRAVEQGSAS
jgi:hypothetical protein